MIKRLTKTELSADRAAVDAMIATMQADHQAKQLRLASQSKRISPEYCLGITA
jgi:hypothetical protein